MITPMGNGFGMKVIHFTPILRIAPLLIQDSGVDRMAGKMKVTGSGGGSRMAVIFPGMNMATCLEVMGAWVFNFRLFV